MERYLRDNASQERVLYATQNNIFVTTKLQNIATYLTHINPSF